MDAIELLIIGAGVLVWSALSGRIERGVITAPMAFTAFGFAVGPAAADLVNLNMAEGGLHLLAEATLALVLFTDAARINVRQLARDHVAPLRMLLIALPLTILFGAVVGAWLFDGWILWEAALLAAILAPTDAALGQAVVSNTSVPTRIRQALTVESGLNDGLALPVVLVLAAVASGMGGMAPERPLSSWITFAALQVTLGPLAGVLVGVSLGRVIDWCLTRHWMDDAYEGAAVLAVPLIAYLSADLIGGNGFIAAFVAGAAFGAVVGRRCSFLFEFMENEGRLLVLLTFFLFGGALIAEHIDHISWVTVVYTAFSLTVIRVAPIMLSLTGAGFSIETQLFLGWFGPRGLASILFALLVLEHSLLPHAEELMATIVFTVLASIILHGVTAAPWASRYGRRLSGE